MPTLHKIFNMVKLSIRFFLFLLIFFTFFPTRLFAQEEKDSSTTLSVSAASLVPVGIAGAIYILNYGAFWKYATQVPFWVSPDPPYAMHIDKFAHGYLSAFSSSAIRE